MKFREYEIYLNTIERVKSFVDGILDFDFECDIYKGRYVIDATSIMGIFSLDLSDKLKLVPHTDDEKELQDFENFISRYQKKGV